MGTRERGNDDVWCLFNPRQKWMETERRKREFRQIKHLLGWRQLTGINGRRAQKEREEQNERARFKKKMHMDFVWFVGADSISPFMYFLYLNDRQATPSSGLINKIH